jgi:hypothetical protein
MMKLFLVCMLQSLFSVAQMYGPPIIPAIRTNDYYIELAPYWEPSQPTVGDTLVVMMSPYGTAHDKFRENITLSVREVYDHATKDLYDYVQYLSAEFLKNDPTAVALEQKLKKDRNGTKYWYLTFQVQYNGMPLRIEQRYYLKKNTLFILSFCYQYKADSYNTWLGHQIMRSFYMM